MERRRLSSRQIIQKTLLIIVITGFFFYGIYVNSFAFVGILFFAILGVYRMFYLPDLVEFDDDYLYVIYKEGTVEVNLKDIYLISEYAMGGKGLGRIKFRYENTENEVLVQHDYSKIFKNFKPLVLSKNPDVVID